MYHEVYLEFWDVKPYTVLLQVVLTRCPLKNYGLLDPTEVYPQNTVWYYGMLDMFLNMMYITLERAKIKSDISLM